MARCAVDCKANTSMLLKNKVAIVTGAATGIGEGIATLLADEGANVLLLDRNTARNHEVAGKMAGLGRALTCDVRRKDEVRQIVDLAIAEFGRIDVLVNNAGIYPRQTFLQMSEQQWDEIQDVNLKSMFHTCQAVLPNMVARRSGKIVNISSVTFHLGAMNLVHYVSSKGGVIGFTRALAREMGSQGVFVNCVTPGAVLVDSEGKVATDDQIRAIVESQSIKRRILPVDIARVCVFLASHLSDGMTGQTLNVDGGWAMY
jgi:3-oxoacyl-[acyl-carrier protein] reductase